MDVFQNKLLNTSACVLPRAGRVDTSGRSGGSREGGWPKGPPRRPSDGQNGSVTRARNDGIYGYPRAEICGSRDLMFCHELGTGSWMDCRFGHYGNAARRVCAFKDGVAATSGSGDGNLKGEE